MKFIGIKHFEKLLVDGTEQTRKKKNAAITEAMEKMGKIIEKLVCKTDLNNPACYMFI